MGRGDVVRGEAWPFLPFTCLLGTCDQGPILGSLHHLNQLLSLLQGAVIAQLERDLIKLIRLLS